MQTRILLIGKNGQVGWELQTATAGLGEIIALDHQELDLTVEDTIRNTIRQIGPALIINAAAYTAVDAAEDDRDLAFRINGWAPGVLAEEALRLKAGLIHYSTDYVFDGLKSSPYSEDDSPVPINVYGASKLAGEQAILASNAAAFIFRTSWVYGTRGKNFFLTMLRLASSREEVKVVNDQFGAPTWSRSIAAATAEVIRRCFQDKQFAKEKGVARMKARRGIYNMTERGTTSWHGFAKRILENRAPRVKVTPIRACEYSTRARRPQNSVLNGEKLQSTFGVSLPLWEESLNAVLAESAKRAEPTSSGT
jgi:dTDP-4-dehydrorhamnose reductase